MTEARSSAFLELRSAFERGDFAAVRRLAEAQLARPLDEVSSEERRAVEALVARTSPGRLATLIYGIAALIVLAVAGYWVIHAHK
jgi:hypothetical protein